MPGDLGRLSSRVTSLLYICRKCQWTRNATTLRWRHNGRDSVSNQQPHDCFLNRLFRHKSKKTSKLRVTGLYAGNSPEAGEFPAQMASNAENVSIWWRHHQVLVDVHILLDIFYNILRIFLYTYAINAILLVFHQKSNEIWLSYLLGCIVST